MTDNSFENGPPPAMPPTGAGPVGFRSFVQDIKKDFPTMQEFAHQKKVEKDKSIQRKTNNSFQPPRRALATNSSRPVAPGIIASQLEIKKLTSINQSPERRERSKSRKKKNYQNEEERIEMDRAQRAELLRNEMKEQEEKFRLLKEKNEKTKQKIKQRDERIREQQLYKLTEIQKQKQDIKDQQLYVPDNQAHMKYQNLPPRNPANQMGGNIDLPTKQIKSKQNTARRYPTLPNNHSLNIKPKQSLNKPPRNIEHNMSMKNMATMDRDKTIDTQKVNFVLPDINNRTGQSLKRPTKQRNRSAHQSSEVQQTGASSWLTKNNGEPVTVDDFLADVELLKANLQPKNIKIGRQHTEFQKFEDEIQKQRALKQTAGKKHFDSSITMIEHLQKKKNKELQAYQKLEDEINNAELDEDKFNRALALVQNINPTDTRQMHYIESNEYGKETDIKIHDEKIDREDQDSGPRMQAPPQDDSDNSGMGLDELDPNMNDMDSVANINQKKIMAEDEQSKDTLAHIIEADYRELSLNEKEGNKSDDLFFPTEIETDMYKIADESQDNEQYEQIEKMNISVDQLQLQMVKNDQAVSRQVAIVNQQDKYLDLDAKIFENYNKQIKDRGWTRQRRSAAKMPPSVLFGIKSDAGSLGTAASRSGVRSNVTNIRQTQSKPTTLGKMNSALNIGKTGVSSDGAMPPRTSKSRQSYRTAFNAQVQSGNSRLPQKNSQGGLGFSAFDIGISSGINIDRLLRQKEIGAFENKFVANPLKGQKQ